MNRKKLLYIIGGVAAAVAILAMLYCRFASVTRVATLNFPDFTVEKFIRSNDNPFIKINPIGLDEAEKIAKYDFVLVRIHGSSLNGTHLQAIKKAIAKGVPVYATESDNPEINTLSGRELEYIDALMANGSIQNYRSLFNYVRKHIDRKALFNEPYAEPVPIPEDYYFHLGDDQFFATYEEYQKFYEESGRYREGAPRVALLSGNINMQNSNEEHMAAIINSLEERGLNVYPINSFGMKKLGMIRAVAPDVIINRPHGRLVMGGGESGTRMLRELNVPILAPVTVSDLYENWLTDRQGMASGGMTSMSIVMPELDGAVAPYAVAAQFERNGMKLFDAIPVHTEKFCSLVEHYARLHDTPNSEKKVAIYYYKGAGKGAVSAADIEGVQSLYNTLKALRDAGYDVSGLPADAAALERMIQTQGSVLGPYALGAYDEFLKHGNPELVDVETFTEWTEEILPEKLRQELRDTYGEAPGEYMGVEKEGRKYIAVARIVFGNVAILPQPLPAVGEDTEKIVHGVEGAPAYPYVASYLWTRKGFGADALIHFGTHGSLEFIPGKQVALSDYDWTDALVGDMPHFYIYTINNIGEGIIAKRRSYATLVTHLTAPFMQSELYDELKILKDRIHRIENMEESSVKQNYRETITEMAARQNILSALDIDSTRTLTDADIDRVHIYLEEIDGAKVNDGLYTLGVPYSDENLRNTARLMSIDPIRYSLASLDAAKGLIDNDRLDDIAFINHRYGAATENAIAHALAGENPDRLLRSLVGAEGMAMLEADDAAQRQQQEAMMQMMRTMAAEPKKELPRFLDEQGNIIPAAPQEQQAAEHAAQPAASMMEMMAQATPAEVDAGSEERREERILSALKTLREALQGVKGYYTALKHSTDAEPAALLNALNGGYVEPCSAGDPIVNPQAVPTGRNFYSINPETTPSAEAWKTGKRLAEDLLAAEMTANGKYPEKVSFTLWSTDFISSEGATIAQILYLLGVEPMRDGFGYIRSLRLIPSEQLGRPRIDVVVQTSGQLRDIAASRLELINDAIAMAAEARDEAYGNYVRKGFEDAERLLLEKGFSPADARKYAGERIFGGLNGSYGTGIMGLVEKGDAWESEEEIARQYIHNMGALYSANGSEAWGEAREGVFEAALLNTSVVVQPRSSNTWGPLSLDHVYEFMGGMSAAVRHVTGNDPTGYFNDFRNTGRPKVQGLKEAIGVETNSTVFNPKYIREMMKGEASSMETFAETFRNTYGWNAMKPSAIDQHIWNKYYDVYVEDAYDLGLEKTFSEKNPYALQEMTAVMLESARKGMWHATDVQLREVAELHTRLVSEHAAGCSGFICDNAKLRDFIASKVDKEAAESYNKNIDAARQVQLEEQNENNVVLQKEEQQPERRREAQREETAPGRHGTVYWIAGILLGLVIVWLIVRRKQDK